ncbi:MAG: hypothetical protein V3R54_05765 [Thermodesulfovibrionia bacterium]
MDNEKMIPICCNHFGITTNNGQTFILEFRFQEPSTKGGQPSSIKTFSRVAIDRIGIERFINLLQTSLEQTKSSGNSSHITSSNEGIA